MFTTKYLVNGSSNSTAGRAFFYVLLSLLLLFCFVPVSMAQTGKATLRVTVKDPNNAVVPNATVTVTNERTGDERRVEVQSSGDATFASLDSGTYTVKGEAPNFKVSEQRGVALSPNDTRGLVLALEVGLATEVVNVAGGTSEIQTETGAKENTLTADQIQNLSIVSRSALELLRILPGVVSPGADDPSFQSNSFNSGANANNQYHVNGLRGENNSISIDGSRVIDIGSNNGSIITANPDMVQEVKVQTSNYAAEHGTSGVQITATTKGGGRGYHGQIYDYMRDYRLNANDRSRSGVGLGRAAETYKYPGGSIGGPVILPRFGEGGRSIWNGKDKLFFFFGLEYQRQQVDPGTTFARVPTAAQRLGTGFFNRNSGNAAFNLTPAQLDPIGQALIKLYPLPNFTDPNCSAGNQAIQQCNNYAFAGLQPVNRSQATLRFDYKVTNNVSAYVRLAREAEGQEYARGLWWNPSAYELPSHVLGTNLGRSAAVGLTAVISPTMTNEVVLSGSKLLLNNDYKDPSKIDVGALGLQNLLGPFDRGGKIAKYAPIALITSWSGQTSGDLWEPGGLPLFAHNSSYSAYDNLTKVSGAHTLKFGGVIEQANKQQNFQSAPETRLVFAPWGSGSTGDVFADILSGHLAEFDQGQRAPAGSFRLYNYEFYGQDSWKVKPNFTLEYGVRGLYYPNNEEVNGLGLIFDPSTYVRSAGVLINNDPSTPNGVLTAARGQIPKGLVANPPVALMPRLNFAWDIGGKGDMVIRGGAGTFYNRVQGNYQYYVLQQPPNAFCGDQDGCSFGGGTYTSFQNINPFTLGGTADLATTDKMKLPRITNVSLTFEKRLPFKNVATIGYVGTFGRHLPTQVNINTIPLGRGLSGIIGNANLADPVQRLAVINANAGLLGPLRPFPAYGNINQYEYTATSEYHSLQVTLSRQLGKRLTYFANYTFSKALGVTATDETGSHIDPVDARNRSFGILPFDRTHIFNLSYSYLLPNGARGALNNGFGRGLLKGWQLSGISTVSSGIPIYLRFGGDLGANASFAILGTNGFNLDGRSTGGIAPIYLKNPQVKGGGNIGDRMFDLGSIGIPTFGKSGPFESPFYLRSPARMSHDITVFKNFNFTETKKLQFRAAFFNVFNQAYPRWVGPGDANNDVNTNLNVVCNVTRNGIANGTGTSDNVCDPTQGFSFTQDTIDNFGKITRKRGHRVVELALKFYF